MTRLTLALAALLIAGPALAQQPRPIPKLTGNIAKDFAPPAASAPAAPSSTDYDQVGQNLQKVAKDLLDKAIADLTAASVDAKNTNDSISQPCWDAQVAFIKLLPAEWQTPPTEIGPALGIQIGRDLRRSLTGDQPGSLKVACAALLGDELAQITKLGSIIGVRLLTGGIGG